MRNKSQTRRKITRKSRKARRKQRGGNNPSIFIAIFEGSVISADKTRLNSILDTLMNKYNTQVREVKNFNIYAPEDIFLGVPWGYKNLSEAQKQDYLILQIDYNKQFDFLQGATTDSLIDTKLTKLEHSLRDTLKGNLKLFSEKVEKQGDDWGVSDGSMFVVGMLPDKTYTPPPVQTSTSKTATMKSTTVRLPTPSFQSKRTCTIM